VLTIEEVVEQHVHPDAVAPVRIEAFGQHNRELVLMDLTSCGQHRHEGAGRLGVVGPLPWRRGQRLHGGVPRARHEELRREGIANGEPVERDEGSPHPLGCSIRRLVVGHDLIVSQIE
jgi:hypothetical protein